MSRGVEARGSFWTPGVPRALGWGGRPTRLETTGLPGASIKNTGDGVCAGEMPRKIVSGITTSMRVNGKPYRTIWLADDGRTVRIIDQTLLPHRFEIADLRDLADAVTAIRTMQVP